MLFNTVQFFLFLAAVLALFYGSPRPLRKYILLAASYFFKYFNFLGMNLAALFGNTFQPWNIVLPLGISFHTFQSMSYVVDVYRGEQRAVHNPVDYALFICFFPQLVAGPIVRARDFFRDLLDWRAPTTEDVSRALFLLALGLTKKMAFADQFAIVADGYFTDIGANPGTAA